MNRAYLLTYEKDGVYFETTGPCGYEDKNDVFDYIERKNLQQLELDRVHHALDNFPCHVRIAPDQPEHIVGETAAITISDDQMEAFIRLLPPDTGGSSLTWEELIEEVALKGVTYGIDNSILSRVLEARIYGERICFAKGLLPQDGKDGELVFHFNTESLMAPAVDEKTGKVDYRNLNLFMQVSKGQKLVSRIPATRGKPGYTVTGREIKDKSVKEAKLPAGKNVVYDEERMTMFAGLSGRVDYKNRVVTVSSCYSVKGDADLSIGNITFDGDVIIKGNVISDITIEATGNIEVNGSVEGARLMAGKNIVLKSGIQGNDKGVLQAGGDVVAKYIERSKVRAGGNVIADAFIHSRTESGDTIVAKGKYGSIIGGTAKAQNSITAQTIGSAVNSKTCIEVGLPPSKRERLKYLGAEIERLREEIGKCDKIINYLSNMENLPSEKEQMKRKVIVGKLQDTKLLMEYTGEMDVLEEDIKRAEMGKVHVTDIVYPGTKLAISLGEYAVVTPIKFSTFYCKNREVAFIACQI